MNRPLVSLLLAVTLLGTTLAGCAAPEDTGVSDPSADATAERLGIEPLAPDDTDLAVEPGESVTFVVECQPPGLPEEVVVEWDHAIRDEGVKDRHQDFQSSKEPSAFSVTFEEATEHIVTAVCTTDDDRTRAQVWNVTVEAGESVSESTNGTNESSPDSTGNGSADSGTNGTSQDGSAGTISPEGNLTVHFVDVGQGDGIVLHFPDSTVVVDTGRWSGASETAVRDHLQAEGVDPDALVITHPDADHAGGCDEVLAAFEIEALYHPGIAKDTQTWADCEQAMDAEGSPVHTDADLDPGDVLNWSAHATVELVNVDASSTDDPNEGSIALEISYGTFEMVLTGDVGCDTEEAILEQGLVGDIELVQVGHHGSRYSTCDTWLDATRPEAGVISVGENSYGHPTDEVLDRLATHGIDVYRTDLNGTVTVETNGTTWEIRSERTGETADTDESTGDGGSSDGGEAGPSGISIGTIHADAEGNDHENLNDEWVEIVNDGNESTDMGGWTLSDEAEHTYTFPSGFALDPGASVKVHTGSGEDTATDLYWGSGSAVWNNAGDTAVLEDDGGEEVDRRSY